MISPSDYAEFVRREYLSEFVRAGGSSVKFVVSSEDGWATALDGALRAAAASEADDLDLATLASRHAYDPAELLRDFKQKLQQLVLQDFELTQEFRIAMLRLCVAQ